MNMKKHLAVTLSLAMALGVSSYAPSPLQPLKVEASSYNFTKDQQEALNHINAIRKSMGLQPVTLNPFLNKMAENHTNYLVTNGYVGAQAHNEDKNKKGFTGATPQERAKAVGLTNNSVGELASNITTKNGVKEGINFFIVAPYHRDTLISKSLKEVGVSYKDGITVINVIYGDESHKTDHYYPYNGQRGVGTLFKGEWENPNPLKQFNVAQSGYVITYNPPTGILDDNIQFTLKDSKGTNIPYHAERSFGGANYFFPKQELKPNETYTATATYKDEYDGTSGTRTWSFTTGASTSGTTPTTPPKPTQPTTPPTPTKVTYVDFSPNQYWSQNMLWAIDKGLVAGYMNVKNPKTGKLENWLKPQDMLTEAQFLTIMFRQTHATEFKNTKPTKPNYSASVAYQLSSKYKLPTKANLNNLTPASKPITRGEMARLLVSNHLGKTVSEKTAVDYLIANKITSQKDYNNFMPKDTLQRAHIVTFMKNFDTFTNK